MVHTYISVCILLCLFCDRDRLRSSAVWEKSWSWSWQKSLIYITGVAFSATTRQCRK